MMDIGADVIKFALPKVRRYARLCDGMPYAMLIDPGEPKDKILSVEESSDSARNRRATRRWDALLKRMIRGMELYVKHNGTIVIVRRRGKWVEDKRKTRQAEEGIDLFREWMMALWI